MELILDKAKKHFEQNLPFVLYCKPASDTIVGVFQQNDRLFSVHDFTEKGFVFASFDGNKTYLLPENESEVVRAVWEKKEGSALEKSGQSLDQQQENNFEGVVAKAIQAIANGEFKKVVVSRRETVPVVAFDLGTTFEKLVQLYPSAFVYCFYHPKVGIWLGATPEQLLKADKNRFETIALAGTQNDKGASEIIWEKKEKEEQQFVTDYIVRKLESVASEVLVSEPYSVKAGSLWHIKTNISGVLNSNCSLQKVIELLHPTPAVCGLPKEKSKAFILENENYDRSFYTGFLGELNSSFTSDSVSSDLFVNLRCMQIVAGKAYLYMGCGITKDSMPEKEWRESVNKSATMKKVL